MGKLSLTESKLKRKGRPVEEDARQRAAPLAGSDAPSSIRGAIAAVDEQPDVAPALEPISGGGSSPDDWPPDDADAGLVAPLSELYDVLEEGFEECDDLGGSSNGGVVEKEPPDRGEGPSQLPAPSQQQQQQQQQGKPPPAAPAAPVATGAGVHAEKHARSPEAEPSPQHEPFAPAAAYLCPVCGVDLSAFLILTDRAAQVKACMAGKKHKLPKQPKKAAAPRVVPASAAPAVPAQPEPAIEGIKEWLEGQGLAELLPVFEREEITMGVAHTLTQADLDSIGIRDRRQQARIVTAAQRLAAARAPRLGAARRGAVAAGPRQAVLAVGAQGLACALPAPAAAPKPAAQGGERPVPRPQQQQQRDPVLRSSHPGSNTAGVRPREQALLDDLYPGQAAVGEEEELRCTPLMPPSEAPSAAQRVPPERSLWACAATGLEVVDSLEARLLQRQEREPEAAAAAAAEPLARGCVGQMPVAATVESRASKLMKVAALREELRMHEETAAELQAMIAGLEAELQVPGAAVHQARPGA